MASHVSLTCTLCGKICKRGVTLPCCGLSSKACRNCAIKMITETRQCWVCMNIDIGPSELINHLELREACKVFEDKGIVENQCLEKPNSLGKEQHSTVSVLKLEDEKSLKNLVVKEKQRSQVLQLTCTICGKICKRGVTLPCCGINSKACRNCAIKRITGTRECWVCMHAEIGPAQLINHRKLREACNTFEEKGIVEDHLIEKLKSLDIKQHSSNRTLKVKGEKENPHLDDKFTLSKLLLKEKLKRKEKEVEQNFNEMRKIEAKKRCKDMLRKDFQINRLRDKKIVRQKGRNKVLNNEYPRCSKLIIDQKKMVEGTFEMKRHMLKPWIECGGIYPARNIIEAQGYGHRDGLGYSFGRARKNFQ